MHDSFLAWFYVACQSEQAQGNPCAKAAIPPFHPR